MPKNEPKKEALIEIEPFDNSEIETHCKCDRMDYYRFERHLVHDEPSKAMDFGTAWHSAMDVVWSEVCWQGNRDTMAVARAGLDAFNEKWMELGYPGVDEFSRLDKDEQKELSPQTPMVAAEMLYEYVGTRMKFMSEIELVQIETPFIVPIYPDDPSVMYSGKIDKVIRMNSRIYGIDHKTTSWYAKEGFFRSIWIEGFSPDRQFDGYLYALKMIYGKEAKAVWADAALVHRDVHDGFKFIPVEMQGEHLDAWLWETRERIKEILHNRQQLDFYRNQLKDDLSYLPAFPKKPEACTLYMKKCPYMDLCRMWANPESHPGIPDGYREETWSPFDEYQLEKLCVKEKKRG